MAAAGALQITRHSPGPGFYFDLDPIVGSVFRPREELGEIKRVREQLEAAGESGATRRQVLVHKPKEGQ